MFYIKQFKHNMERLIKLLKYIYITYLQERMIYFINIMEINIYL